MRVLRLSGRVGWLSLMLAATLAGSSASAGPVADLPAPHPLQSSAATEANPIGGVFMAFLAQITSTSVHLATLHDFLVAEEPAAMTLELIGVPAPRPRQAMIHGLLTDIDLALHALQEGGDDEHFLASREIGPGTYLRVAQQAGPRSGPY